jgi:hypothetical protein
MIRRINYNSLSEFLTAKADEATCNNKPLIGDVGLMWRLFAIEVAELEKREAKMLDIETLQKTKEFRDLILIVAKIVRDPDMRELLKASPEGEKVLKELCETGTAFMVKLSESKKKRRETIS